MTVGKRDLQSPSFLEGGGAGAAHLVHLGDVLPGEACQNVTAFALDGFLPAREPLASPAVSR